MPKKYDKFFDRDHITGDYNFKEDVIIPVGRYVFKRDVSIPVGIDHPSVSTDCWIDSGFFTSVDIKDPDGWKILCQMQATPAGIRHALLHRLVEFV